VVERSVTTGVGQKRFCVPVGTPDWYAQQSYPGPAPFQGAAPVAALPVVTLRSTTG